jgi:hypothetical protein
MTTLGRLQPVALREVWTNEAAQFTPWLSQSENLRFLGEAIGIELDLECTEKDVGPFRADILCKETGTGYFVLVENQIERTDHNHLGQLLTYAAGLSAVTIVWVASKFTDEHRAALDWLNEVTCESINFFGLEVELWKIGDSLPAPKFNVVSRPNAFVKRLTTERGQGTQNELAYIPYWEELRNLILEKCPRLKPGKPAAQHWLSFQTLGNGVYLEALAGRRDKYIQVQIWIANDVDKSRIRKLLDYRDKIATELPGLIWDENPAYKRSAVRLRISADPVDESDWRRQHEWFVQRLEAFHRIFAPLAKEI